LRLNFSCPQGRSTPVVAAGSAVAAPINFSTAFAVLFERLETAL
jgi:hypothetical protein